jgi:hypothetical protein
MLRRGAVLLLYLETNYGQDNPRSEKYQIEYFFCCRVDEIPVWIHYFFFYVLRIFLVIHKQIVLLIL